MSDMIQQEKAAFESAKAAIEKIKNLNIPDSIDPEKYNRRHGGPFDRGSADSYYGRKAEPHYYVADTYSSEKIEKENMTDEELTAYYAGRRYNEQNGDFKDWD